MLRYVLCVFRLKTAADEAEEWIDYLKRSATIVDAERERHDVKEWSALSRCREWRFAGKTARQTDKRWSHLLLDWLPTTGHGRLPGRPRTRWSDNLVSYVGGNWIEVACDEELWAVLEHGYVNRSWQASVIFSMISYKSGGIWSRRPFNIEGGLVIFRLYLHTVCDPFSLPA